MNSFDAIDAQLSVKNAKLLARSEDLLFDSRAGDVAGEDNDDEDDEDIYMKRRNIPIGYEAHVDPITRTEVLQWNDSFAFLRVVGKAIDSTAAGATSDGSQTARGNASASELQMMSSESPSSSSCTFPKQDEDIIEEVIAEDGYLEEIISSDKRDEAIVHSKSRNEDFPCPTDEIYEEVNDVIYIEKWKSIASSAEFGNLIKALVTRIKDNSSHNSNAASITKEEIIHDDWGDSDW